MLKLKYQCIYYLLLVIMQNYHQLGVLVSVLTFERRRRYGKKLFENTKH